jgi:hypothetical protein
MCYNKVNPTCNIKKLNRFIHWGKKAQKQTDEGREEQGMLNKDQQFHLEEVKMSSSPRPGRPSRFRPALYAPWTPAAVEVNIILGKSSLVK